MKSLSVRLESVSKNLVRRAVGQLTLAGMLAISPPALHAQESPPADTLPRWELEPVVVTVTRAAALPGEIPQKVEVVSERELDLATGEELVDVLKREAALDVIQYPGLLAGVGIRGFRPQFSGINQRTLLLIDGRPAGLTNLAAIDLHTIERVEVLKGPASALYGSNAMGGAVNIITRRSRGPLGAEVRTEYGSWETFQGRVAAGGRLTPALDFDLGFAAFRRGADYSVGEGNLFRDLLGDGTVEKNFANDSVAISPDLGSGETRAFSEYGTLSGNLRLGYRLSDAWRVDARGELFSADDVQNPGDLGLPFDNRSLKDLARASADVTVAGELNRQALLLKLFAAREDADYYREPEATSFISFRTPTRWYGAQLQDAIRFGPHLLVAGADYTSTVAESEAFSGPGEPSAPFSPNSGLQSRALFAEGRFGFAEDRLVATVGGRLDNLTFDVEQGEVFGGTQVAANEESYTVFNPSAGLQYTLPAGVRVHGTVGRAFVAPNAFNVAGYSESPVGPGAVAVARGNPELEPENSVTWDAGIGIARQRSGFDADVTYFQTDVRDRISTVRSVPSAPELTPAGDTIRSVTGYVNVDQAEIRGLEWRFGYDLGTALAAGAYRLRLWGNATHIFRAEEISQGGGVDPIRNVADLTLGYGVEYDSYGRWRGRLTGRYVGERWDTDFSDFSNIAEVRYPQFMTLDLLAEARVWEGYRVGLVVQNLTDENYYEVRGYPLPGRSFGLRFTADFR